MEYSQEEILKARLNTVRNIYDLLKTEFHDLPRGKIMIHDHKVKVVLHRNGTNSKIFQGTCDCKMSNQTLAHAHWKVKKGHWRHRWNNQICFKKKTLLEIPFLVSATTGMPRNEDIYDSECLVQLVAHEAGHLVINSCRHCKRFKARNRRHQEFLRRCELDGRLQKCIVQPTASN